MSTKQTLCIAGPTENRPTSSTVQPLSMRVKTIHSFQRQHKSPSSTTLMLSASSVSLSTIKDNQKDCNKSSCTPKDKLQQPMVPVQSMPFLYPPLPRAKDQPTKAATPPRISSSVKHIYARSPDQYYHVQEESSA
ncbi:Aste57867_11963 [Aphanomyces stellatus]|uniref:Aste57867_11963 protein n=1 Tax=Aphanomyces stellatus TaxID=120398 RepID=A0A485KUR7_9STRA|nr:hypothetical protein As57867_011918 [Aphanomyces stellatus]VFT88818.1 Aste57867_11963 [Aphanomyces stellatus]